MIGLRGWGAALAAGALLLSGACRGDTGNATPAAAGQGPVKIAVTVHSANGPHIFQAEVARTVEEQQRGLMFRTNIPADGGMIFIPYPAEGGGPREAHFWMKNTPSPLDIIFIRPNGTIATIANAVPYSEQTSDSEEPVNAVLEINGGRAAELGIAPGDKVTWDVLAR